MKRSVACFLMSVTGAFALCAIPLLPSVAVGGDNVFSNPSGTATTVTADGRPIDRGNPFFQELGVNGRRCVTCHQPGEGWGVTPAGIRARFQTSQGTDPIFRTNDGANSPLADVSTLEAKRKAYSMLLTKGLIRIGIGIPDDAEFELAAVDDPYGYASASELSLFRRPLPTTNLPFLTALMWDGREPDLQHQANEAVVTHAAGRTPLTEEQRQTIVDFETSLYTAQTRDNAAGNLTAEGAAGGAVNLRAQTFYVGINDLLGDSQTGVSFNNFSMTLYDRWTHSKPKEVFYEARQSVARGEALFNSKPITITGVKGVNDNPQFGSPAALQGFCTTCHDSPNVGNHSVKLPLDIGLTDASRRTPDMPLYTLRNKVTGETIQTTDPGRALISGKWKDIARFKGPILRGLAARAPYFHNGSAATLDEVLDFYQTRFGVTFTAQEKADLVAFLKTL